jgi:anhydro-N-acetylmuramic acid kinase
MVYKVIGLMSGSSLDGLDIAYVNIQETGGNWAYEFIATQIHTYSNEWVHKLKTATTLNAYDYQLLHTAYGHYIGNAVNKFIEENMLQHKVHLVASHGHTTFHTPHKKMTAQLGDGAAIAAVTGLPVVSDLRAIDVAFGGQGAPIVPIGEQLLLGGHQFFLNLGGIANVSADLSTGKHIAFDICAANRVLNMLIAKEGKPYDDGGALAATGKVNQQLLQNLNELEYYAMAYPKSLANDFGTDVVYPLVHDAGLTTADALATYTKHIAMQIAHAVSGIKQQYFNEKTNLKLLATGGGVHNIFLVNSIKVLLANHHIEMAETDDILIDFKEALVMALIGVLRWREEYNVLASVTGATRNSINGALWLGVEA